MLSKHFNRQSLLRFSTKSFCSKFNISAKQKAGRSLYLDNAATTPLDFRVLDAMLPYMTNLYGNPHSRSHVYGWESEQAIEKARASIGDLINADAKEIVFTSGATESNNLAIKGLAKFYGGSFRFIILYLILMILEQWNLVFLN